MTNAVLTELEIAAIPTAIAVLKAVQAFGSSIGTDPLQYAVKVPGAFKVLVGTLELQVPTLAQAEGGAVIDAANARVASWIASLQSKIPAVAVAAKV